MTNTQLKAYKVSEITFNNKVQSKVKLKLNHKVSHNVKYTAKGFCEAYLTVEVLDNNNPDLLNIKVVVAGVFEIKNEVEKEFIHVETFKELFPFAKSLVTTITANAGIQPIIVQNVDIENHEIYRWNVGNKNKPKEEDE
ncbi:MAG: protein-export chaperone SecB [Ruminococcus sp.]|nr:protein-export chaperone SecB [Ruminococcus sp.]